MHIMMQVFNSYEEALQQMKKEYNSVYDVQSENIRCCDIYKYSAYIVADYDYSWEIQRVSD